jgi:hypothetical protein
MQVLGSNLASFLTNLNNLHLHLSVGWPSMRPPAFRCEQVRWKAAAEGRDSAGGKVEPCARSPPANLPPRRRPPRNR